MCVILVCQKERPSPEVIERCYSSNGDGAGIAWREEAEDGMREADGITPAVEVVWQKGLNLEELQELVATLPLPFVVHCRISSCGGKSPYLTHPFPITDDVPTWLAGRTKGEVLFHNGHWGRYKDVALNTAVNSGGKYKLLTGKLSDTRVMAWCVNIFGRGFIDFIEEKAVVFSPKELTIFSGGSVSGWQEVVPGILASNGSFQGGYIRRHGDTTGAYSTVYNNRENWKKSICNFGKCISDVNIDSDGRCPLHPKNPSVAPAQEADVNPNCAPNGGTTSGPKQEQVRQASGGTSPNTPFAKFQQAIRARKLGKISKKQFKRARNQYASTLTKAQRTAFLGKLVVH